MKKKSVREFPFPTFSADRIGQSWCVWCGNRIWRDGKPDMRRHWHPECVTDYNLYSRPDSQYKAIVKRDGERCAWEGCGAVPMRWKGGYPIRITRQQCWGYGRDRSEWIDNYWDRPEGIWTSLSPEERSVGEHIEIERIVCLEIDHRVPLWSVADLPADERRWYFGPENLWLLCPDHHKQKTKSEAAERARKRATQREQGNLAL